MRLSASTSSSPWVQPTRTGVGYRVRSLKVWWSLHAWVFTLYVSDLVFILPHGSFSLKVALIMDRRGPKGNKITVLLGLWLSKVYVLSVSSSIWNLIFPLYASLQTCTQKLFWVLLRAYIQWYSRTAREWLLMLKERTRVSWVQNMFFNSITIFLPYCIFIFVCLFYPLV